jgi:23S rRNA pseudouridine1911/1915/1917 synthase
MPLEEWIAEEPGRLDRVVAGRSPDRSRAQVQRWIGEGRVQVNGRACDAATPVRPGDRLRVDVPEPQRLAPEARPLDVLYEDAQILVLNKPAGLVTHPGAGNRTGTLAAAIVHRWPEVAAVGDPERPGIVHRLDKDTSGVLVVARTEAARLALLQQFQAHRVEKIYLALVEGHLEPATGLIDAPIGRRSEDPQAMAVRRGGREARTRFRVLEYFPPPVREGVIHHAPTRCWRFR